jgi:hypothetical protein
LMAPNTEATPMTIAQKTRPTTSPSAAVMQVPAKPFP